MCSSMVRRAAPTQTLNRLPQELLKILLDYVAGDDDLGSRADLKAIRLVNKTLAAAAAHQLFNAVPVWLGLQSLQCLTQISEHPVFSRHVTKIVFSPLRFRYFRKEDYNARTKDRLERECHTMNAFGINYGKQTLAWKWYQKSQDYLTTECLDLKILTRALRNLPNLDNIHVDNESYSIGATEIMRNFGALNGEEITLDGLYTIPTLVSALAEASKSLRAFRLGSDDAGDLYNGSLLYLKNRTCSLRLPQLNIADKDASLASKALSKAFAGVSRESISKMFFNLDELEINNLTGLYTRQDEIRDITDGISQILKYASNLSQVDIGSIEATHFYPMGPPIWPELFSNRLYVDEPQQQRLRIVYLRHVKVTESDLTNFFKYNRNYLKTVDLSCMEIIEPGTWVSVLDELRQWEFPQMKTFTMSDCVKDEEDVSVKEYITKLSDVNPIAEYIESLKKEEDGDADKDED